MIRLERVGKVYQTPRGAVRSLEGIDLEVPAGQFVVVRGPSGSGKSTLLLIAGGLQTATSGRVVVAGEDLTALGPAARARFRAAKVGFVFQTFHLLPYLSVLENIALGGTAERPKARRQARELLDRFQLGHRMYHRPAELSTGECQRVAIARALINRPALILADEPTGNLDPANSAAVLDMLAEFHQRGGTVLLVTHQEGAVRFAQQTVSLKNGTIE